MARTVCARACQKRHRVTAKPTRGLHVDLAVPFPNVLRHETLASIEQRCLRGIPRRRCQTDRPS
jgi:hypothetical protein